MDQTKNQKKLAEKMQRFRLLDDEFFSVVLDGNIACVELIVRIIMGRDDIRVKEVHTQKEAPNFGGHSVKIDVYAVNENDEPIIIEVQRADVGANPKRARFYSSIVDVNHLEKGAAYDSLPESYVIFITENDVLCGNLPVYHIERQIAELGKNFGDGAHIIYVSGAYENDGDALGKLMHDFRCSKPEEFNYTVLAESVKDCKESDKEARKMSKLMEELATELAQEMAVEMAEEKAKEMAQEMAQEMAEEKAKEMAEEKAKEMAEEKAKEMAEEKVKEMAEEMAKEMAADMAQEMAVEMAKEMAEEMAKEKAKEMAEENGR